MKKTLKLSTAILLTALLSLTTFVNTVSAKTADNIFLAKYGITADTTFDKELGYQIDEEIQKNGLETIIGKTYIKPSLIQSLTCATFYKTESYYFQSNLTLQARVYTTFCWDEAADTIYVNGDPSGTILYNTNWTISNESTSTSSGGGILSKHWASGSYRFKRENVAGLNEYKTVTVKIDSAGKKLSAD